MLGAAFLAILIAAPAAAPQHPSYLTGRWFGQGEPHDKTEMWLAQALPNGDFVVQFRICRKGQNGNQATDLYEKGKWWFQDGTEYVQITWSDGMRSGELGLKPALPLRERADLNLHPSRTPPAPCWWRRWCPKARRR
jgi:hypothetical protein